MSASFTSLVTIKSLVCKLILINQVNTVYHSFQHTCQPRPHCTPADCEAAIAVTTVTGMTTVKVAPVIIAAILQICATLEFLRAASTSPRYQAESTCASKVK